MNYRYAIIDMCDDCRVPLLRNDSINVTELGDGEKNSCRICNKNKVFTKKVLTDYKIKEPGDFYALKNKSPITIQEGFQLLFLEDVEEKLQEMDRIDHEVLSAKDC